MPTYRLRFTETKRDSVDLDAPDEETALRYFRAHRLNWGYNGSISDYSIEVKPEESP